MFEFEACEVFKTKDFTFVNDCFKYERNEEIRHYGQTLNNKTELILQFETCLFLFNVGILCSDK
jgi:hypothetical protein